MPGITITTTKDVQNTIKVGLYGNAGVGKTTLAAACPSPLIVSAESGLISLKQFDLDVVEITKPAELAEVLKFLSESDHKYETVIVDSLSEIAEQLFSVAENNLLLEAETEGKGYDPRQAYGQLAIKLMKLTKRFRSLPLHVVYTAKQGFIDDEGIVKYGPAFPGKAYTKDFPYLMSMLWCVAITKKEGRILRLQPNFQYYCKTRGGHKLPDIIGIPDINSKEFTTFLTRVFEKVLEDD